MRTVTVLGLAAAVMLAACGGSSQAAASTANAAHVWHLAAQCVRDHGQSTFPDPSIDSSGHAHFPPGTQDPPQSVMDACQHILNQLPASERQPVSGSQNDPAMMLRFAQCMREHGISDWPDPDSSGAFHFPPSLAGNLKTGPRWQSIRSAWTACDHYNPSGHIYSAP